MAEVSYDSIVFDLDGTLWDAADAYSNAWNMAASKIGTEQIINRKDVRQYIDLPLEQRIQKLYGELSERELHVLKSWTKELQQEMLRLQGGEVYPGVKEGLKQLKEKANIYLISTSDDRSADAFIEYTGLKDVFTDTISQEGTGKGFDENLMELMKKHGLSAPVVISDNPEHYEAIEMLGMPFIQVTYGYGKPQPSCERQYSDFSEVVECLS